MCILNVPLFMATLAGGNNEQPDLALCISGSPFQWKNLRIYIYMNMVIAHRFQTVSIHGMFGLQHDQ